MTNQSEEDEFLKFLLLFAKYKSVTFNWHETWDHNYFSDFF
jgi:hypothetical protein